MWPGSSPSAVVNGAAGMIIAALIVAALYAGRDLFMPLALAGLLGFVLAPLVRRLTNWGLPNGLSVALVIALLLGSLFAGGTVVGRQLTQLLEDLPTHEANLRDKARFVHFELGGAGIWQRAAATARRIDEEVRDPQADKPLKIDVAQGANDSLTTIFEYMRMSAPSLMSAVLVLLLTIFMLLQYRDLRDRMVRLMGTAEMGRSTQAFDEASANLAHYLLLQSGVNVSFGVFVALSLWAIGIPSPILWGGLTAVLRFVPYFGVLLSAAFPMALAAMIDPGWWKLMETGAVFIVGDPLLGQFVEPLLFGHQTRLSALAVLIGISFWSLLWGPVGLVLAVPLTLAIVVMGQHLPRLEFLRILLGNEPALKPHEHLYHQFLADEASLAAKEAEHWIGEHTFENYLDEIAIPTLRVAADDQKRGVLGREQFHELSETIAEYLQLVQETLEYGREQQTATVPAKSGAVPRSVLVLAGRGSLDLAAAQLIAEAIRLNLGIAARCASLGGLTGIGAAAEAEPDAPPDTVVLVSVGTVTSAQLKLLLGRIRSTFPRSQILVGYWDPAEQLKSHDVDGSVRYAESVASLVELVRRKAEGQTHDADLPIVAGGLASRNLQVVAGIEHSS
jgi:predicted PurR-regulated permease PerM